MTDSIKAHLYCPITSGSYPRDQQGSTRTLRINLVPKRDSSVDDTTPPPHDDQLPPRNIADGNEQQDTTASDSNMAGEVPLNQQGTWVSPTLPGPTVGSGGVATVVFSTQIAASPARCLEVALDSARYPAWNKFIRKAIIEEEADPAVVDTLDASLKFLGEGGVRDSLLLPGTRACFMSYMDPDSDSCNKVHLVVTVLKEITHEGRKGFRVAWAMQGVSPQLMKPCFAPGCWIVQLICERTRTNVGYKCPPIHIMSKESILMS